MIEQCINLNQKYCKPVGRCVLLSHLTSWCKYYFIWLNASGPIVKYYLIKWLWRLLLVKKFSRIVKVSNEFNLLARLMLDKCNLEFKNWILYTFFLVLIFTRLKTRTFFIIRPKVFIFPENQFYEVTTSIHVRNHVSRRQY